MNRQYQGAQLVVAVLNTKMEKIEISNIYKLKEMQKQVLELKRKKKCKKSPRDSVEQLAKSVKT